MKKRLFAAVAFLLLCSMLLGTLVACKDKPLPDDPTEDVTTTPEEEKAPVRESILTGDYADLIENA